MEIIKKIEEIFEYRGKEGHNCYFFGYMIKTDKQEIFLLIDNRQKCCEEWGYFMSLDNFDDFIGATIEDIALVDTCLNSKKIEEANLYLETTSLMFVNVVTNKGVLQFTAYNEHSGDYGHDAKIISTQLSHEETL